MDALNDFIKLVNDHVIGGWPAIGSAVLTIIALWATYKLTIGYAERKHLKAITATVPYGYALVVSTPDGKVLPRIYQGGEQYMLDPNYILTLVKRSGQLTFVVHNRTLGAGREVYCTYSLRSEVRNAANALAQVASLVHFVFDGWVAQGAGTFDPKTNWLNPAAIARMQQDISQFFRGELTIDKVEVRPVPTILSW